MESMKFGHRMNNYLAMVSLLVIVQPTEANGKCKNWVFLSKEEGHYLRHHSIENLTDVTQDLCQITCYMHKTCMSYNYCTRSATCEINDADKYSHPEDFVRKAGSVYVGTDNACINNPCPGNAICQPNFYTQSYSCFCPLGFLGPNCTDIDECETDAHDCSADQNCVNTEGSFECRCNNGSKMFENNCVKIAADYNITVYVGGSTDAGAGTANMFIQLHGSQFKKNIDSLKVQLSGAFEEGSIKPMTPFNGKLPNMERISKITMSHDNTGSSPSWYSVKVIVDNKTRRMKYTFECEYYLLGGTLPLSRDIWPSYKAEHY